MTPRDDHRLEVDKGLSNSAPIELIRIGCVASARSYQDALPEKLVECSDRVRPLPTPKQSPEGRQAPDPRPFAPQETTFPWSTSLRFDPNAFRHFSQAAWSQRTLAR
jgi:hypothetical protein